MSQPGVLACDPAAIPPAERPEHQRVTRRLASSATEIIEVADGLAFQLPSEEYATVMSFVARERCCCPFLGFRIEVSPGQGPVRLTVTGPPGVRDFLLAELRLPTTPR